MPVVEEAGEAGSREDIVLDEKANRKRPENAPPVNEGALPIRSEDRLTSDEQLPSLPKFNRLSMGLGMSKAPIAGSNR